MRGSRSRRQPATSGTRMSSPRCSSGSCMIHHPPGPLRPESNARPRPAERRVFANACNVGGRRLIYSVPSMISATRCAGASSTSWYVARPGRADSLPCTVDLAMPLLPGSGDRVSPDSGVASRTALEQLQRKPHWAGVGGSRGWLRAGGVQSHNSPRLNVIASNGRMLTGSSSFALAIRSHCPSWSSNASRVRSIGSMSHRWATPSRA